MSLMKTIKTMSGMKDVFPHPITNEFINAMERKPLSETQKALPYACYYHKDMALIPQEDLDKVNAGPIDPNLALPIERAHELLQEGYLDCETGYCTMPDGTGFAATKVFMPGVTTEMIDWWFNWHPLEDMRYMIWCPVGHTGISAKTPEAHLDSSGVPLHIRNIGKIHYPQEGFTVEGTSDIEIAFYSPTILGITPEMMKASPVTTFELATCINRKPRSPINVFFHTIREVEGGIEYRSRYWLQKTVKNSKVVTAHAPFPKSMLEPMIRNNCIHSLTEYHNLASILPELYTQYGGKIEG